MFGSWARLWWKDSERLKTTSGAQTFNFSTMCVTLSKTARVSTSWPRRCRHSSTLASVGFCSCFSVSAEKVSCGSMRRATSKRTRIFISDRPLESAGVQVIGHHCCQIGSKLEVQLDGVGWRHKAKFAAALDDLAH